MIPLPLAAAVSAALVLAAADQRTTRDAGRAVERLVDGRRFEPIATVAALPEPVRAELARLMKQTSLSMADPGQPFQHTDVIAPGARLPGRRLVFAGHAGDLAVVHYEAGGFAHTYSLVVFRVADGRAESVAATRTKGRLPGLGALDDVGRYAATVNFEPFHY
jgi:hypothetical protein